MSTENWFFPNLVHLRMRDQSLLKFAVGPQPVPSDLPEEEREILKRNGAKPIEVTSKTPPGAPKTPASASPEGKGTSGQSVKPEPLK